MRGRGDQQGLEASRRCCGRMASRSNAPTRPRALPFSERDGEVIRPEPLQPLGERPRRVRRGVAGANARRRAWPRGNGRRASARPSCRAADSRPAARFSRSAATSSSACRVSSRPVPRGGSAGPICASSQPCGSSADRRARLGLAEPEPVRRDRGLRAAANPSCELSGAAAGNIRRLFATMSRERSEKLLASPLPTRHRGASGATEAWMPSRRFRAAWAVARSGQPAFNAPAGCRSPPRRLPSPDPLPGAAAASPTSTS